MNHVSAWTRPVVVGIDDRSATEPALRFALTEAASRGVPLRIVAAFHWPVPKQWSAEYYDMPDPDVEELRRLAEQLVTDAVEQVRRLAPDLAVDGQAIEGNPVNVLLTESRCAVVLVLGSRELKALGSAALGSVSAAVAARAECPVVVVRGASVDTGPVVVGVDGRDPADELLEYGLEHASRHRVPLRAVLCWRRDMLASMHLHSQSRTPERAERWLAEACAGWREKYPDVTVDMVVAHAHPVAGLVAESATAKLLVVGTHGRRALMGTLLGSVSQGVLHHATCPVAVISVDYR
jgi:nucleotide-binding universal stress UspA family protein